MDRPDQKKYAREKVSQGRTPCEIVFDGGAAVRYA